MKLGYVITLHYFDQKQIWKSGEAWASGASMLAPPLLENVSKKYLLQILCVHNFVKLIEDLRRTRPFSHQVKDYLSEPISTFWGRHFCNCLIPCWSQWFCQNSKLRGAVSNQPWFSHSHSNVSVSFLGCNFWHPLTQSALRLACRSTSIQSWIGFCQK